MNNAVTHYNRLCVNLRARVAVQQAGLWVGCMFNITNGNQHRSPWPRGLRLGFVTARLVGSCFSVPCECCMLSGRGLCDGPTTRPEESYRVWCV
jgi:hypothetical protein